MPSGNYLNLIQIALSDANVQVDDIQERSFPGERWIIVFVPENDLLVAQTMATSIERSVNESVVSGDSPFTVYFRSTANEPEFSPIDSKAGRLFGPKLDQLIQLLEARSRTSDALPSLNYVEDPRASLAAVAATRHQFVYGRRGVGKTALLLEAKRRAERKGDITVWMNAQTFRYHKAETAFLYIFEAVLTALARRGSSSETDAFAPAREKSNEITKMLAGNNIDEGSLVGALVTDVNRTLRRILRPGLVALNIYLDDFYFYPIDDQPRLLDYVFATLRDCDGWIKVASIERLTRPFEPSSRIGLEIPHDASKIDLDITLEDPNAAQDFLENILSSYTKTATVGRPSRIAKGEALGRLVLASGGVPRDYMTLFASSIVTAREARSNPQQVGREDVAVAAGRAARGKKRDLEVDAAQASNSLLVALEHLANEVKGKGFTYFRVNIEQKSRPGYEALARLVDLRFVHLIQAVLSDQHRAGTRYEAYTLDLSEYTDVRMKRGLEILDLEERQWISRLTGTANTGRRLTRTKFRDQLRQSPLVDVDYLIGDDPI
jgi:hypothetical protein